MLNASRYCCPTEQHGRNKIIYYGSKSFQDTLQNETYLIKSNARANWLKSYQVRNTGAHGDTSPDGLCHLAHQNHFYWRWIAVDQGLTQTFVGFEIHSLCIASKKFVRIQLTLLRDQSHTKCLKSMQDLHPTCVRNEMSLRCIIYRQMLASTMKNRKWVHPHSEIGWACKSPWISCPKWLTPNDLLAELSWISSQSLNSLISNLNHQLPSLHNKVQRAMFIGKNAEETRVSQLR